MHFSTLLGLAASVASAQAVSTGFNYGNMMSDGTFKDAAMYEAEFKRAQTLQGTDGQFTSARLYTMIQGGTDADPNAAFEAAIKTQTSLLLGMWASGVDEEGFQNEVNALAAAIEQYGDDFAKLVVGISVGSEDLYRISPTGIENDPELVGAGPDLLVSFIKMTRDAIKGTALADAKIGHVDTWTAFVNETNFPLTEACDWIGVDSYPYFQNTVENSIGNANKTFWDSYDNTVGASHGKEVWITETGWPVSGPKDGLAVASVDNAETYWQEVGCALLGNYNTWWYTLQDDLGETPSPSFGLIGADLNSEPLYDLKCKPQPSTDDAPSENTSSGTEAGHATPTSGSAASGSASAEAASQPNTASKAGAAAGAAILAVFGLMAAL